MTTDWRALCAELTDALHNAIRVIHHEDGTLHISTAEPVLDRARAALAEPEPEGPTDEELAHTYWTAWHEHLDRTNSVLHAAGLRAVLARWGHQPAPPAAGEVAELAEWLRDCADDYYGHGRRQVTRAADLLEQRHPEPVPMSERLPGAEDCDAEGRCWWFCFECPGEYSYWILAKEVCCDPTYWLPANALPLPAGEVEP